MIRNVPQAYASDAIIFQLHCDCYDRLTDRLTASDCGFFPSKVAFINFSASGIRVGGKEGLFLRQLQRNGLLRPIHKATETVPARARHRPS